MIDDLMRDAKERMKGAIEALKIDLSRIRTGRASPALVQGVVVEYYGMPTPLNQLATISAPEPQLLTIRPFDRSSLGVIEKAILKSELGLTPNNDGRIIRLAIPRLTEERRQELVKVVNRRLEEARVAIRNVRRDVMDDLRSFEKEKMISEDDLYLGKDKLQEITDEFVEEVSEVGKRKEIEIMEV
ncbi:MAG: ribosome recycling factor [Anaerolineales bacterium]|nr:ribosome recycling factor [Anaerolineales bacterium]